MVIKMGLTFRITILMAVFSGYDANQTIRITVPLQGWYTASVDSSFVARCESDDVVIWWKRENEGVNLEGHITKEGNSYVNSLIIKDIIYRNVGFYDCIPLNDTSNVNASFYLYVDDPVHLMLGPRYRKVYSKSYQPAVVPCRPTALDVSVKLLTSKREHMPNSTAQTPNERDIYFDPHLGFIMPSHLMQPAWFIYICEFSKRGTVQEVNVDLFTTAYLDSEESEDIVQDYAVDIKSNVPAKPGDTVVLPIDVFTQGRSNNSRKVRRNNGQVFELEHGGVITERSNKIRVEETDGTRVVIQDVDENDERAGIFTSYKECGFDSVFTMFNVHVGAFTDELIMDIPKVIRLNDHRSIRALCLRKLDVKKFKIEWSFRPLGCPDLENTCEEKLSAIDPLDIDKSLSKDVLSAAVLEVPRLGNLTCTIYYDNYLAESVTKPVVLSEVKDGFEVRKVTEKVDDPNTVTLQCIVSKYLYSDHLYWISPVGHVIEDSIISDTSDYIKLSKSENEYSFVLELVIKNVDRSRGDYRCMAVNNDHIPEFRTYLMTTPVPVPPKFFANLDNNTLLVPTTSTVVLSCESDGNQIPSAIWMKDGTVIGPTDCTTLIIKNVTSKDSGKYTCELFGSTGSDNTFTEVVVYEPDATKIENMDVEVGNDLKADISKQVALQCQLYGQSYSKVEWYKNGEKLPESPRRILLDDGSVMFIHPASAKDAGLYSCRSEEADTDLAAHDFLADHT